MRNELYDYEFCGEKRSDKMIKKEKITRRRSIPSLQCSVRMNFSSLIDSRTDGSLTPIEEDNTQKLKVVNTVS